MVSYGSGGLLLLIMFKICVITSTRADYGIMQTLIKKMCFDADIAFRLCVTGTHLSKEFGYTRRFIDVDSSFIDEIDIIGQSSDVANVSEQIILKFTPYFQKNNFDMVVVLGDRYEMFYIASVAYLCRTKIAHIHGGESSFGSLDEEFRHCITKLSNLHFTSCEKHRQRVIQLGEDPKSVFDVGSLSVENIKQMRFKSKKELADKYGFVLDKYIMLTFNPVTSELDNGIGEFRELLSAISEFDYEVVAIYPNIDSGKDELIRLINGNHIKNMHVISSMPYEDYLSLSKNCDVFVGNSSSGIIEIPILGVPVVNVGRRQLGREKPKHIENCRAIKKDIVDVLKSIQSRPNKDFDIGTDNIYYKPNSSDLVIKEIKKYLAHRRFDKVFFDMGFNQTINSIQEVI